MKQDLGKGGIILAVVLGVLALGAVVYFGFFKTAGYTAEDQARNDAQTKISDQNFNRVNESLQPAGATNGSPRDGRR